MLIIVFSYVHNLFILFSTQEVFLAKRGLFILNPHRYVIFSPLFSKLSQFITNSSLFSQCHHSITGYIPKNSI